MIELPTLLAFTIMNMGFALIPGPDVLCILSHSVAQGPRAGYRVCLGIATACLFHAVCAALGLTAILAAVPSAFFIVKVAGALYLAWLGWRMLRHPAELVEAAGGRSASPFLRGALSNLLNPKIALFFLAILPQFVRPERGTPELQALVLGLVSIVSGTAVNLVTATLGGQARRFFLTRTKVLRWLQQAAGVLLLGFAVRVAAER